MNLYDTETESYFSFDEITWDEVGTDGTGGLGHYSQQGNRTIYASPRPAKHGKHRFVISGTGYYAVDSGGLSWGTDTYFLPYADALELMDPNYLPDYVEVEGDTDHEGA